MHSHVSHWDCICSVDIHLSRKWVSASCTLSLCASSSLTTTPVTTPDNDNDDDNLHPWLIKWTTRPAHAAHCLCVMTLEHFQWPQGCMECLCHLCISFCQYWACWSCHLRYSQPSWRNYCYLAICPYPQLANVSGPNVTIHVCSSFTILAPMQSNLTYFTRFPPSPLVSVYSVLCTLMSLAETRYVSLRLDMLCWYSPTAHP